MKFSTTILLVATLLTLTTTSAVTAQDKLEPQVDQITWPSFPDALQRAAGNERIILIDVYANTCPWCRKLQSEIYTQAELQSYVYDTFELGRIDIGISNDTLTYKGHTLSSAELGAGFGATGTPTTIFLEPNGTYITRLPGFHQYDEFFQVLKFVGSESFRDMSFADYLEENGISLDGPVTRSTNE